MCSPTHGCRSSASRSRSTWAASSSPERWRVVVAGVGGRITLVRSTLINLAGVFVRNVTPTTGLGVDASRIALLRAEGVGLTRGTAAFVCVRLAEIPAIAIVIALALPSAGAALAASARGIAIAAVLIAVAAVAVWLGRKR